MLFTEIVVREFLEGVVGGIRNNIRTKQITINGPARNTGETEKSLYWKYDGNTAIVGSTFEYITVLEDGRKPGKFAPPDVVQEWVRDKIVPENGMTIESLAYLINKKMSEKGSLLYQQGGNSGVLSEYLNEDYIRENLTEKLRERFVEVAVETLFK
jgi:hypothetical protein